MRGASFAALLGFACGLGGCPDTGEHGPGGGDTIAAEASDDGSASDGDAGAAGDAGAETGAEVDPALGLALPTRRAPDAVAAAAGRAVLESGELVDGLIPRTAFDYLYLVWGTSKPADEAALWRAVAERYGMVIDPARPAGPPVGVVVKPSGVGLDCLLCHTGEVAGQVVLGAPNTRLDVQGLYDDLVALAALAQQFGFAAPAPPFPMSDRTGAAGANDAFGLGLAMSTRVATPSVPIVDHDGYQRAPAWWAVRYKDRLYCDGAGTATSVRTMMATLLAYTSDVQKLVAALPKFDQISQAIGALEPPAWPFGAPDAELRAAGREVFDAHCAECHGVHSGAQAAFPDKVSTLEEVGTDPVRATAFGANEAAWLSQTWLIGAAPMTPTGGYLAPPLAGIWARAPYFHNGAVPDLAGVLDSQLRPVRWKRTGSGAADYDPTRVGWRFETVAAAGGTGIIARRVFDTTKPGLAASGHDFGDALTIEERRALLEYLKGL